MSTDKDKGLIGSTSDQLKETTGILRGQTAWHSANSDAYHNNPNCRAGNNIKAENLEQGPAASHSAKSANGSTTLAAPWVTSLTCSTPPCGRLVSSVLWGRQKSLWKGVSRAGWSCTRQPAAVRIPVWLPD